MEVQQVSVLHCVYLSHTDSLQIRLGYNCSVLLERTYILYDTITGRSEGKICGMFSLIYIVAISALDGTIIVTMLKCSRSGHSIVTSSVIQISCRFALAMNVSSDKT